MRRCRANLLFDVYVLNRFVKILKPGIKVQIVYDEIRKIDNSPLKKHLKRRKYKKIINGRAGREHYKLLTYLGLQLQGKFIVELGTHHGLSSLALSVNPTNEIRTYDIVAGPALHHQPSNVTRVIGNIFDLHEEHYLLKADLIFLDTAHTGEFEWQVYSYLKKNNYRGIIVYDDILWSDEMVAFWQKIDVPKYDITDIGHGGGKGPRGNISGTGVVDFSNQIVIKRSPENSIVAKIEALFRTLVGKG